MDVLQKLRSIVVPEQKRMTKAQLLQFYEENRILERMQLYYNKPAGARKVRSKVAVPVSDDDEDPVPSSMAALAKLRASKIRKMLREFAKDLGVKKNVSKMSKSKVRGLVRRNRLNDILTLEAGERDTVLDEIQQDDEKQEHAKPPSDDAMIRTIQTRMDKAVEKTQPVSITINTGDSQQPVVPTSCPDSPETNMLKRISPHLYKTLQKKNAALDMCNMTQTAEATQPRGG